MYDELEKRIEKIEQHNDQISVEIKAIRDKIEELEERLLYCKPEEIEQIRSDLREIRHKLQETENHSFQILGYLKVIDKKIERIVKDKEV